MLFLFKLGHTLVLDLVREGILPMLLLPLLLD
jgi:hypothetical protein